MTIIPRCFDCKHLHRGEPDMVCDAFPDGIPDEILLHDNSHLKPYPGDHGIQFEAKEPSSAISPKNESTK